MKLKSLALAAALLPAFGSAFAEDITIDLLGGPNVYSAFVGNTHTEGAFSDTFTFTGFSGEGTVPAPGPESCGEDGSAEVQGCSAYLSCGS